MSSLNTDIQTTANNLESDLLDAVAHVGQKAVVEGLPRDKGAVSNFFSSQKGMTLTLKEMSLLLALLDRKTIDKDQETFDKKEVQAAKHYAYLYIKQNYEGDGL